MMCVIVSSLFLNLVVNNECLEVCMLTGFEIVSVLRFRGNTENGLEVFGVLQRLSGIVCKYQKIRRLLLAEILIEIFRRNFLRIIFSVFLVAFGGYGFYS